MNKLRLISLLCVIAMLIGCFAMFPAFAAEGSTAVETPTEVDAEGNGAGTVESPYLLYQSNFADYYNNFDSTYRSKHVKLMEDITVNKGDATEWVADATKRPTTTAPFGLWTGPMGGGEKPLTGSFDGNGHTISGVCLVGTATTRRVALFAGISEGATVKNLKLTNSYFEMQTCNSSGSDEIASFASRHDGTISNCYSDAILVNNSTHNKDIGTGGIVGGVRNAENATIENCVFAGSITQTNASVNGNGRVGGILGFTLKANTSIKNCLFAGTINAAVHVGGILGNAGAVTTVEGCMSIIKSGALKSSGATISDFYAGGSNNGNVTVTSMYVVAGLTTGYVGSGGALSGVSGTWANIKQVTFADLNTPAVVAEGGNLAGWNFKTSHIPNPTTLEGTDINWTAVAKYWTVDDGKGTDGALYSLDDDNFQPFFETNKSKTGNGSDDSLKGNYILKEDITLNDGKDSSDWATSKEGVTYFDRGLGSLSGIFDGNGRKISGICIYNTADVSEGGRFIALFGVVTGTVQNLTLENSYIYNNINQANDGIGTIAGRLGGTITNCHVGSDVIVEHEGTTNSGSGVGGLAGEARGNAPTITDSTFAGVVKSPVLAVGGILGVTANSTTVSHCTNMGAVTGTGAGAVGGIVGQTGAAANVSYCANSGTVTGTGAGAVGGIVGQTGAATAVSYCTNAGTVTGSASAGESRAGGIIGNVTIATTTINDCLNAGTVKGTSKVYAGGIVGNLTKGFKVTHSMNLSAHVNTSIYGGGSQVTGDNVKLYDFLVVKDQAAEGIAVESGSTTLENIAAKNTADRTYIVYIDSLEDLFDADIVADGAELEGWSYKEGFMAEPSGQLSLGRGYALGGKVWTTSDAGGTSGKWYMLDNDNFASFYDTNKGTSPSGSFVLIGNVELNAGKNASDWATNRDGVTVYSSNIGTLSGTFDGNGHTISGLCIYNNATNDSAHRFHAMFGTLTGTVRDLTIKNSYFYSNNTQQYNGVGAIAGRLSGSIINCHVASDVTVSHKNDEATADGSVGIGGLAGDARNGAPKVIDSTFAGVVKSNSAKTGGIVGITSTATTITNCVNSGSVTSDGNATGGIVGSTYGGTATISNCVNTGTVTSNKDDDGAAHVRPGGILGNSDNESNTITNCLNTGAVVHTAGNKLSGGILGNAGQNTTIENCLNLSNKVQSGNIYAGGQSNAVVVTSFYRVRGLGIDDYASGKNLENIHKEIVDDKGNVTNAWTNVYEITLVDFVKGTYLAGWVREDGYLPVPNANVKIELMDYITADYLGLDSTGAVHSVRISEENPGLRFETKVNPAVLEELAKLGIEVTGMNTYITLAKYVTSEDSDTSSSVFTKEALEAKGIPYLPVTATKYLRENADGTATFAGSVVNVKPENLTRLYTGIGCITLTDASGNSFDVYAKYSDGETASVSHIAFVAANDTKTASETGYTNEITDIYGKTVYSPYTQAQYNSLEKLMDNSNLYIDIAEKYSVATEKMEHMELSQFYNGEYLHTYAQGGVIVGDYAYTCMVTPWNRTGFKDVFRTCIVKTNINTGEFEKSESLELGVSNDATYNPDENVIIVTDGGVNGENLVHILDADTLKIKESRTLKGGVQAIAYDEVNERYITIKYSGDETINLYIYSKNFELLDIVTGLERMDSQYTGVKFNCQGIHTDGSYLYILEWHGGSMYNDENNLTYIEAETETRLRIVEIKTGKMVDRLDLGIQREPEYIGFNDGNFYIAFNNKNWTGMEMYSVNVNPVA